MLTFFLNELKNNLSKYYVLIIGESSFISVIVAVLSQAHTQTEWTDWWRRPSADWWAPARCWGCWRCHRRWCRWSWGGRRCSRRRTEVSSSPATREGNSDTPASTRAERGFTRRRSGILNHSCVTLSLTHTKTYLTQDQRNHHSHEELREDGRERNGGRRAELEERRREDIRPTKIKSSFTLTVTLRSYSYVLWIVARRLC